MTTLTAAVWLALTLALTVPPMLAAGPSAAESACLTLHATQDFTGEMRPYLGEEDSADVDSCIQTGELTKSGN